MVGLLSTGVLLGRCQDNSTVVLTQIGGFADRMTDACSSCVLLRLAGSPCPLAHRAPAARPAGPQTWFAPTSPGRFRVCSWFNPHSASSHSRATSQ